MANVLPWENGSFMPWMVGQTFVGPDGATYQTYPDPASPTGFTAKRRDANGESFVPINAPTNPTAAQDALFGPSTPYGQRLAAAEAAQADQNTFNRGITQGTLDVNRQNADTSLFGAQTTRMTAESQAASARAQIDQAKKDLEFKYYQQNQNNQIAQGTLDVNRGQLFNSAMQIGAGLRGPYDWDSYLQTRAMAGQNPMLQQAGQTWSSLTNIRPNTGAVAGPAPRAFDINALAGDFMNGGGGGSVSTLPRDANLDAVARNPGSAAPGWWQGLSEDERQRARGYWDKRGESSTSILNSLAWTQPTQGLGYAGA